jgi:hypothetical protein
VGAEAADKAALQRVKVPPCQLPVSGMWKVPTASSAREEEDQREVLRIIAAITQGEVIRQILRHLKLSAEPPPLAPARVHQEAFAWSSA